MIATVYKLPSWILNQDNKPSLELFNLILENSASDTLEAKTYERPTYTKLNIQSAFSTSDINSYNYVLFDGNWYAITSISYLQDTPSSVIYSIEATIDIYLSFIVKFFSENSQIQNQVFFKQKHMNRWMYDSSGAQYINFSQQFYLRNKHRELAIGSVTKKVADSAYNQIYNNNMSNVNSYSYPIINGVECIGYVFAIWKMTSNTSYSSLLNNWTSMGLVNIQQDWNIIYYDNQMYATGLPANYCLTHVGSDAYVDWTVLPVPIDIALIYSNGTFNQVPITNIGVFSGYQTIDNNTSDIPGNLQDANNTLLYPVEPQNLIYIIYNPSVLNSYSYIQDIFMNEPYVLQYCSLRVRGAGEDAVVDITGFNNWTTLNFLYTMYSFQLSLNHPNTQFTNVNINHLKAYTQNGNTSWLEPYEYNDINDAWWTINWKAIYPSSSNNWNNYMLNNANHYHMGLNITHYSAQAAQADVGFNTAKVVAATARLATLAGADEDPLNYLFGATSTVNSTFNAIDGVINSSEQLTNSIFSCMSQTQEYKYQLHGKQQDMSRTANERLSVSNNIISYNNFALTFIWEQPVNYDVLVAYNYITFNGYIVERWIPFMYWYNRKYLNYVKIAKFTDTMIYNLNSTYKALIDNILNKGLLIWTSANGYLNTLPYSDFTYQNKGNPEVNLNNDEVNILNGEI